MDEAQPNLRNLENTRLQLEENVTKIRALLQHWQQCEIEYESIKEEIVALGETPNPNDLRKIVEDDGTHQKSLGDSQNGFLNAKERMQLLQDDRGNLRNANSIVELLSKRLEYIQQFIKTLTSLLNPAEAKLAEEELAASAVFVQPTADSEEGLPLTEILEELDEDGNVISTSTSSPHENAWEVIGALRQAGVDGQSGEEPIQPSEDSSIANLLSKPDFPPSDSSDTSLEMSKDRPPKPVKRVSFAKGTKAEPEVSPLNHPRALPEHMKQEMLRKVCAQIEAESWRSNHGVLKYQDIALDVGSNSKQRSANIRKKIQRWETAEIVLQLPQNREVRRLLKHGADGNQISLKAAARLLSHMVETQDYHVSHYTLDTKRLHWSRISAGSTATVPSQRSNEDEAHTQAAEKVINGMADDWSGRKSRGSRRTESQPVAEPAQTTKFEREAQCRISDDETEESKIPKDAKHQGPAPPDPPPKDGSASLGGSTASSTSDGRPVTSDSVSRSFDKLSSPVIPKDEATEEAALRHQMLQYNMGEVGAVVAELNLDDDDGEYSDNASPLESGSEWVSDDGEGSDEEEDEYGRASSRILTNEYIAEMRALENKLKTGHMVNIGRSPVMHVASNGNAIKKSATLSGSSTNATSTPKEKAAGRKGVRFAEELDVQEAPSGGTLAQSKTAATLNPTTNPVVERTASAATKSPADPPKKKPSRFKAARVYQSQNNKATQPVNEFDQLTSKDSPTRKNPINASVIIERPFNPKAKPSEPDDLDPVLVNQQINTEYYRLRNRMIGREGGFSKPEERAEMMLDEGEYGSGARTMSRFRAARLGRS